jgi:LPXTG-motif cell wall-anchored protein
MSKIRVVVIWCSVFLMMTIVRGCPDEKYCLSCFDSKDGSVPICSKCENSFYNSNIGKCDLQVKETTDHCMSYRHTIDRIECDDCERGYFLHPQTGICGKCSVENCAVCNEVGECFGCRDQQRFDPAEKVCRSDDLCRIENCEICQTIDSRESCKSCRGGFALKDRVSGVCIESPPNCFLADPEIKGRCRVCSYGNYITLDGLCKPNTGGWHWVWITLLGLAVAAIGYFLYLRKKRQDTVLERYQAI